MSRLGFISAILNRYCEDNKKRFYQESESSGEPHVACWHAWAASHYLEIKGERQLAMAWIGRSCEQLPDGASDKATLVRAEVLGLAGRLMYVQGEVGDALPLLVRSGTFWNALGVAAKAGHDASELLANDIRGMLNVFDPERRILPEKALVQTQWLVKTWLDECAIDSWSKLSATQGRALADARRFQDARAAILAMKDWMRVAYYLPAMPERRENLMRLAEISLRQDELQGREGRLTIDGPPPGATREQKLEHLRKQIDEDTRGDDKIRVLSNAVLPLWRLAMATGDVEVAAGEVGASVDEFEFALRVWDDHVINYQDLHCVAQALFNQANSYLRLARYEEARQNYAKCIEYFGLYDPESTLRARHADLVARWKLKPQEDIEAEAREMLTEWERLLTLKPDRPNLHVSKVALCPLYGLMLSMLARRNEPDAALEYFGILRASREGDELSSSREIRVVSAGDTGRHFRVEAPNSLELINEYLPRLPRTVIMFLQNGANELTYLALRSADDGVGKMRDTQLLGAFSSEFSTIFGQLAERQQAELKLISSGRAFEYGPASGEFTECCAHAWQLLPEGLRNWLDAAETIIFCPDPSGNFDKVPIELFRTDHGWLGVHHKVTRYLSIRDLVKMLSGDDASKPPGERAAIVRAEDPAGFVALPGADREVDQVLRYFHLIGLKGERTRPEVAKIVDVLNDDYGVLHYCGHGLATSLGEGLPLATGETLQPQDLGSRSPGHRMPFVFLNACQVGRTRYVGGGRQSGMALALIRSGAPAVVGCFHEVLDGVAQLMTKSFYRAAKSRSVGESLCIARKDADAQGIHPACWGVYALYGDPSAIISPLGQPTN